jgi:hypothetical protein
MGYKIKNFIYMVQGRANCVERFFYLDNREGIDAIFLTYDRKIDGAIYYPNSTWAEGRNRLLDNAIGSVSAYRYYIFVDDDLSFDKGGFKLFEEKLLQYMPAIAMPVFAPKTTSTVFGVGDTYDSETFTPLREFQICKKGDAQFIAFHRDVILDNLVVPLLTKFDKVSWWFTSSTQQLLIFNLYPKTTLQFNNIAVTNDTHGDYTKGEFKHLQAEWLGRQFIDTCHNPRPYAVNLLSSKGIRLCMGNGQQINPQYMIEFLDTLEGTLAYQKKENHRLSEEELACALRRDSELFKQYMSAKTVHRSPG